MGVNKWQQAQEWPLPGTRFTPYYLSGSNANSARGDGHLAAMAPAREGAINTPTILTIRLLASAVILVATAMAVTGALWRARTEARAPARQIAVLPFKPLVLEHRDESLEMGMADTLIARLSNIKNLSVRPLSAVRRYSGQDQDPFAAGRELAVDAVLDGYFQRWGDRIRITARLVSVGDRKQLWAGQFNDRVTDIFTVQDAISEKVTAELALELTGEERALLTKRYTSDTQAYDLYLKGRFFWSHSRLESTEKAIEVFEEAIQKDPNYSLAFSGLADCYRILPISSDVRSREAFPKAKEASLRALEIDGQLDEAHCSLGWIKLWYEWDWAAAETSFRRALRIDPNQMFAHIGYAHLLSDMGRKELALEEVDRALKLDPISLYASTLKGHFLYQARRYPEAIHVLKSTLELNPNYWIGQITIGKNYERVGLYKGARIISKGQRVFGRQFFRVGLTDRVHLRRVGSASGGRTHVAGVEGNFSREVRSSL